MGDTFIEIINTTENEMKLKFAPCPPKVIGYNETADLLPLEAEITLGIKDSARDEILIIDDIDAFQKLPRATGSALIKCKKNFAIVQITFKIKENATNVLV